MINNIRARKTFEHTTKSDIRIDNNVWYNQANARAKINSKPWESR